MIVLGINNMHDASAALMVDDRIVAAAEEERFVRRKHVKGLPVEAMRYCLREAGLGLGDVDLVVAAWRPWVLGLRARLAAQSLLRSPAVFRSKATRGMSQMGNEWKELFTLRRQLERHFGPGDYDVRYLEHHLAHAASAFLCSGFDEAAILTVDGAGEEESTVFWQAGGRQIRKLQSVRLPHSLGQLYSATTAFLGFKVHHDEYKVMGLAASGEPVYKDALLERVLRLRKDGGFTVKPYFLDYHMARQGRFSREAIAMFGPPRAPGEEITRAHADVAASVQAALEEALFHLLRHLHELTGLRRLGLAGGVALNCSANGKIFTHTPFEEVWVQPAAGDNGTALGACLYWVNAEAGRRITGTLENAYLGPSFSTEECAAALDAQGLAYERLPSEQVPEHTAGLLADGNVIGWFQGRMEWGPRALGARSLIADPRRADMKEKINRVIKKREPFRPFAPSVLEDRAAEFIAGYQPSPFMLYTFPVKEERKADVPAIVHTDGTARPQGVTEQASPRYYRLIKAFEQRTGIPMILNTSFNIQEPVVCTPQDAIRTFLDSEMDYLVIEDLVVPRPAD